MIVQLVKRLTRELKSISTLKHVLLRRVYEKGKELPGTGWPGKGSSQLFLAGLQGIRKLDYLELKDEQDCFTLTRLAQMSARCCHFTSFLYWNLKKINAA